MDKLLPFLAENWILSALALALLITFIILSIKDKKSSTAISIQAATSIINRKKTLAIDVRPEELFAKGHIAGSKNIPLAKLSGEMASINRRNPDEIVVICERGITATKAAQQIRKQGLNNVHVLENGLTAWRKEHMPLVKKSPKKK